MNTRAALLLLGFVPATCWAQFPYQIKNIVIIVQENRTPDNLFQGLTPACPLPANASGLSACTPAAVTHSCYNISPCGISNQSGTPIAVPLTPAPLYGSATPGHTHGNFEEMCDPDPATLDCRDDGAWRVTTPAGGAYAYVENTPVTNSDGSSGHLLDPYLTLAKSYGWANYMFQTNQGPSYPAHEFIFGGTSAATAQDDADSTYVSEDVNTSNAGCMAPKNASAWTVSPALSSPEEGCVTEDNGSVQECPITNTALNYPTNPVGTFCHSHQTMADVLDAHSISWKYFAPTAGAVTTAPVDIAEICQPAFVNPNGDPSSAIQCNGQEWLQHVDIGNMGTDILKHIAACDLDRVNWVIPDGQWSDHAGTTDLYGPSWVAAVINAIGTAKTCPAGTPDAGQNLWQDTAIVITWDDWGGWADHELPRLASPLPCKSTDCPGDFLGGFRVPLLVVSAYTSAGFISTQPYDFGSILRFIEGVNHLPEGMLGFADKRSSTDLSAFFTISQPRSYQVIPAQKDASFFLNLNETPSDPDDE
ncbi:MAG TPA: alkaline phosphatase family protein [Terracidiphilus sp.]|nr:alkaline phosphatase family protein [Terracidiphilus sp.]